jgi:hypothetical protein
MKTKSPPSSEIALKDLRRARSLLEGEIFTAVQEAVLKFRTATGLTPRAIDIEILRNDTVAGISYLPTGVSAKVDVS